MHFQARVERRDGGPGATSAIHGSPELFGRVVLACWNAARRGDSLVVGLGTQSGREAIAELMYECT